MRDYAIIWVKKTCATREIAHKRRYFCIIRAIDVSTDEIIYNIANIYSSGSFRAKKVAVKSVKSIVLP